MRKIRPKWQNMVDAALFRYVDAPDTIRLNEIRIQEIQEDGTRITPVYKTITEEKLEALREMGYKGTLDGSSGGEVTFQPDRYVQELAKCEETIRLCQEKILLINKMLCEHFNAEEQEFIRLFWLDVPPTLRGSIWARNKMVTDKVRWFLNPYRPDRPSDSFWTWRKRIYARWNQLLFGEEHME